MHFEASEYMMIDHDDDPDFPDHFTYFEYSEEMFNQRLDYLFQKLLKKRYLDCKLFENRKKKVNSIFDN